MRINIWGYMAGLAVPLFGVWWLLGFAFPKIGTALKEDISDWRMKVGPRNEFFWSSFTLGVLTVAIGSFIAFGYLAGWG